MSVRISFSLHDSFRFNNKNGAVGGTEVFLCGFPHKLRRNFLEFTLQCIDARWIVIEQRERREHVSPADAEKSAEVIIELRAHFDDSEIKFFLRYIGLQLRNSLIELAQDRVG